MLPRSSCPSPPLPRTVCAKTGLRSFSEADLQKLRGGGKHSEINNVLGQLRATPKQSSVEPPILGPKRGPGHAELAAEPGLRPLHSTCIEAMRSPRNTWMGLGRRESGGTGMQDYRKQGNRSWAGGTRCRGGREPAGPSHFGQGCGWDQGGGGWIFIRRDAARNLTMGVVSRRSLTEGKTYQESLSSEVQVGGLPY